MTSTSVSTVVLISEAGMALGAASQLQVEHESAAAAAGAVVEAAASAGAAVAGAAVFGAQELITVAPTLAAEATAIDLRKPLRLILLSLLVSFSWSSISSLLVDSFDVWVVEYAITHKSSKGHVVFHTL
jgi:hypothetical protein